MLNYNCASAVSNTNGKRHPSKSDQVGAKECLCVWMWTSNACLYNYKYQEAVMWKCEGSGPVRNTSMFLMKYISISGWQSCGLLNGQRCLPTITPTGSKGLKLGELWCVIMNHECERSENQTPKWSCSLNWKLLVLLRFLFCLFDAWSTSHVYLCLTVPNTLLQTKSFPRLW